MVSGSSDCTVRVWELVSAPSPEDTGDGGAAHVIRAEVKQVLEDHSAGVLDLRMNERWIVSCSKDTLIHVYSRDTLELVHVLRGHEGPVNAIAGLDSEVDSSGRLVSHVVSASGDGKMILWDVESGERIRVFEGHDRGLACIEFKNDLILSGSNDCTIKLWRASTGECLHTFAGHTMLVRALCFDPHTGYIVSASYDRTVRVWEWREGENAYARERGWPTGDGESRTSTSSATSTRTTASRRSKTQGAGRLIREFRNLHASHIFDVKFDVGKIVR
ncbi:WD40 repeat-like protein [Coniophora puteana RWD-64-598 SS2]|uniref:WD40 repeat-like protein n=1 Tax=Coniophora puteana (strain RWD-64-598) TaxID=741705 RepID=A0A5M3MK02_CONPW|nr:WD40 repeat-like protein [Coniophora puteana RWD-64-598 SS2]EIW79559.1 WD40 repeat-like protein [Coniophora puteana RWD-64-598 SS2]